MPARPQLQSVCTAFVTYYPCLFVNIYENSASDSLYYGDDGCNIKAIDWRKGRLRKIANHTEDIGFTDAVAVAGNLLVASTYDIDTGLVYNN